MPPSSATHDQLVGQSVAHVCSEAVASLLGASLHAGVVQPFLALKEAAHADGFDLTILSAFRDFDRQLSIWNRKAAGELPVLDITAHPIDITTLSDRELVFAILRWSALPGASRHHWGTDLDVYDARATPQAMRSSSSQPKSTPVACMAPLHEWLDARIATGTAFGFYRPYDADRGGVAPERWHLSYAPIATELARMLTPDLLRRPSKLGHDAQGRGAGEPRLPIYDRFVTNVSHPSACVTLRPRSQWGTIPWAPDTYGRSHLGLPLEVWRPRGRLRPPHLRRHPRRGAGDDLRALARAATARRAVGACRRGARREPGRPRSRDARQRPRRRPQSQLSFEELATGSGHAPLDDRGSRATWCSARATHAGSEPETQALLALIAELQPEAVVALHAPLACIDDANDSAFGRRLARTNGNAARQGCRDIRRPVRSVRGGQDNGVPVVTYEFPLAATEVLMRDHVPVLVELLTRSGRSERPHGSQLHLDRVLPDRTRRGTGAPDLLRRHRDLHEHGDQHVRHGEDRLRDLARPDRRADALARAS